MTVSFLQWSFQPCNSVTLPRDKRLETIDLGDPDAGYMREGRPAYNAPFNFEAHVAAEWDERIHADIERRLLDLLPPK